MNIKIRKIAQIGSCKEQIDVEVSKDFVETTFDSVYRDINRDVTIAGFRKGKAPRQLLEKYYADDAQKEAVKRLVLNSYPAAVEERRLNTIGAPDVSDTHFDEKGSFFYRAVVETWPNVKLPKYKGLVLKKNTIEITEEEVNNALARAVESNAQIDANKERKIPAIDDEFAKDLGFENLEGLKKKIKDELILAKELKAKEALEGQLFQLLINDSSFDIPQDLLQRQRKYHRERTKVRMLMSGIKEDEAEKKLAEAQDKIEESTKSQTKLFFILEEIAKQENISVSEDEISNHIGALAKKWGQDTANVKRYFDKHGLWNEMIAEMKHSKVTEMLIKEAEVKI